MKIFISWSEARSKVMAEALCAWIPDVIQACKPWISSKDIDPGARWNSDLARELEQTKFGIICLTPENLKSPWIHFEAGALSKILDDKTRVCPYLLGVKPTDVEGPLVQFQAIRANEEDTLKLVCSINRAMGSEALSDERLNRAFISNWPRLQSDLEKINESISQDEKSKRSDRDLIEEILWTVRDQLRMFSENLMFYGKDANLLVASSDNEIKCLKQGATIISVTSNGIYKELTDHKIEVSIDEIEDLLKKNIIKGETIGVAIRNVRAYFFDKAGIKPPRCSLVIPSQLQ